jgi:threonyl-tRNA synthetase
MSKKQSYYHQGRHASAPQNAEQPVLAGSLTASLALTGAEMPRTSNFSVFTGLADKKDLESHISANEGEMRDHRKLGKDFTRHDHAPGLFLASKGWTVAGC